MNNEFKPFLSAEFYAGRGSVDTLKKLCKKRTAVIFDEMVVNKQLKERLFDLLTVNGGECRFVYGVKNEPYFSDIKKALEKMTDFNPDLIVAVGGGSVIDTAKAIHLFYEYPDMTLENALKPYQLPKLGNKAAMVAIPTTSGTGSETTSAAVFINDETNTKCLMLANELIPTYAILDADLTDSLPSKIAINTGMDALTHAFEAAVCKIASPMVVSIAQCAILDIIENIEISAFEEYDTDKKRRSREACHIAASLAGVVITNSCAGLAHGFDQPGPFFGLPHGMVCGMMLPYTTAFCCPHPVYATIAKRLGLRGENEKRLCEELVDYLWNLNTKMGIPHGFLEIGVDESKYMDNIGLFSDLALKAIATQLAPKTPTIDEAKELFRKVFYGSI